jgi:glucuronate isomerase
MSAFLGDDFLLRSATGRRLYHEHAKTQPIIDYHTHLSAADIASDRRFGNLFEIWLEGDHYKWRAMRANGVEERFCTGEATPYEKFCQWARTVPRTLRNPLYHWSHMELRRYFGIEEWLGPETALAVWNRANETLQGALTVREILRKFRVQVVCTTDDPVDDLAGHRDSAQLPTPAAGLRVLPTFRPDTALRIDEPQRFLPWLERLRAAANVEVRNLLTFLEALRRRHDFFGRYGCRASDHGLAYCYAAPGDENSVGKIFAKAISGHPISPEEHVSYASFLMLFFGHLDAEKGWVKQLHLGAQRNLSSHARAHLGPDTGFDAVGEERQGPALARYLDLLEGKNALPRMVLFNSNPGDNYLFATTASSFQSSDGSGGALQYGPAWWFLDQKDGIINQLNALSNTGLLSRFIGMTTDSRSFMSFPRHEYFRRILCDLIGGEVERGELPADDDLLGGLIEDVCSGNAGSYFGFASAVAARD